MGTTIHPDAPALYVTINRAIMNDPQNVTVLFGTHPADVHTFAPLCTLRQTDGTSRALPLFQLGQATLDARNDQEAERLRVLHHAFDPLPPRPTGLGPWLARLLKR